MKTYALQLTDNTGVLFTEDNAICAARQLNALIREKNTLVGKMERAIKKNDKKLYKELDARYARLNIIIPERWDKMIAYVTKHTEEQTGLCVLFRFQS